MIDLAVFLFTLYVAHVYFHQRYAESPSFFWTKNYPSATPTRKHVDFQRGCSISMFFGFGVLDFGFRALGFKLWVAGFEFGVLNG